MLPDVNDTNSARRAFLTLPKTFRSRNTNLRTPVSLPENRTKHVIKLRITLCWFAQKDITHRLETDLRLLGHEMFSVGFRNARQVQ